MKKNRLYLLWLLFNCTCFYSCLQKWGSDLGSGVASKTDTIGRNLVSGLRDELTNTVTLHKLSVFLDSLLSNLSDTLNVKANTLEDSLLNPKVLRWADSLVSTITGAHLQLNMQALQATLVGKTKKDVLEMKHSFDLLLRDILSDNTRGKIGLIRDELLGPKTNMALTRIIDTAVTHIVDSSLNLISAKLRKDINPLFKEDASFIQRNAIWLLIIVGAIAAGIIFLVWKNRQKYLRMLTIVTKQVHDIPDQQVYDQVTTKIKNDSITAGVEPDLRDLLNKNGLINSNDWIKKAG
jgi:hypothetical protein